MKITHKHSAGVFWHHTNVMHDQYLYAVYLRDKTSIDKAFPAIHSKTEDCPAGHHACSHMH
jgi:hypothetical protein